MFPLAASDSLQGAASIATAITSTILGNEITGGVAAYKSLDQRQLPLTTPSVLYTPGGSKSALVKKWVLQNTLASVVTVTLYLNGTAAANQLASVPIPGGGRMLLVDDGWKVYDANGAELMSLAAATSSKNYSARVYARNRWR